MVGMGVAATAAGIPTGVGLSRRHHARIDPSPAMNCASCKEPMERLPNREGVAAWKCPSCQCVAAELRSLADSVSAERVATIEKTLREARESDRRCPRCGQSMGRGPIRGGYGPIEIDGCVPCRIVWFDPGELRNLRAGVMKDGSPLPSTLTPEERASWRVARLQRDGRDYENASDAALLYSVLGIAIPVPDPVPGKRGFCWTTWGVAAAVAVTSIAAFVNGVQTTALRFGLIPANLDRERMVTLVTYFFVHADPFHLMGNLAYFIVFGTRVEGLIGPARFATVILLATIAGGLAHAAGAPNPSIPLIGASGGISGVIAAYVCLRPRSSVRLVFRYQVVRVPAIYYFIFWILMQAIGAAAQFTHLSAVSALGHLGGAAVGFLLGFAWRSQAQAVDAAAVTPARP